MFQKYYALVFRKRICANFPKGISQGFVNSGSAFSLNQNAKMRYAFLHNRKTRITLLRQGSYLVSTILAGSTCGFYDDDDR